MTIREKAIEAMARGIMAQQNAECPRGYLASEWKTHSAHYIRAATAAYDAAIQVLIEPSEEMLSEGNATPAMRTQTEQSRIIFQAMLKAASEGE